MRLSVLYEDDNIDQLEKYDECESCGGSGRIGLGAIQVCERCDGEGYLQMRLALKAPCIDLTAHRVSGGWKWTIDWCPGLLHKREETPEDAPEGYSIMYRVYTIWQGGIRASVSEAVEDGLRVWGSPNHRRTMVAAMERESPETALTQRDWISTLL